MRMLLFEVDDSSAAFLSDVLQHAGIQVERYVPGAPISQHEAILFANYPYTAVGEETANRMADAVRNGMGLLMTGGAQGLGAGGHAGTPIAGLLPVRLQADDRVSDGELTPVPVERHPLAEGLSFVDAPRLSSFHRLTSRGSGQIVLEIKDGNDHRPLLVIGRRERGRVTVLGADIGPLGGLTEWGGPPLVPLGGTTRVGMHYLTLIARLAWWVGRGERESPRAMTPVPAREQAEPAPG